MQIFVVSFNSKRKEAKSSILEPNMKDLISSYLANDLNNTPNNMKYVVPKRCCSNLIFEIGVSEIISPQCDIVTKTTVNHLTLVKRLKMQVLNVNGSATQLANRLSLSHVICSYEIHILGKLFTVS